MRFVAASVVAVIALSVACTSGTDDGGGGATAPSGPTACRKNTKTERCECYSGEVGIDGDWEKVANCDSPPSGAVVCAHYATSDEVDSCEYSVPHCASVGRNFTTCECGFRDDAPRVASCTGSLCCAFGTECQCTTITGASLDRTQYDRDCTYLKAGSVIPSCSTQNVTGECPSTMKRVADCRVVKWRAPGGGGGGGGSGSTSGCAGCHADSDCGHCGRCTLSTCTCSTKAICN